MFLFCFSMSDGYVCVVCDEIHVSPNLMIYRDYERDIFLAQKINGWDDAELKETLHCTDLLVLPIADTKFEIVCDAKYNEIRASLHPIIYLCKVFNFRIAGNFFLMKSDKSDFTKDEWKHVKANSTFLTKEQVNHLKELHKTIMQITQ